ncbi:MAG: hypothetical protein OEW12_03005, partial [Deltaproteobacteria bacterium]|nr:hypothetical protein [Deltaproteobacteria bacterium]
MKNPFFPSRRLQLPYLAILAALVWLSGCSYHYSQGQFLESKNRWEEAAIEYHLAQVEDPEDSDYTASLERANKVVARENMDRYWEYISQKEFKKAYHRLVDAT